VIKRSNCYYPVFLDLSQSEVIVIGGGFVAERKTLKLIKAGANVTLISIAITKNLEALATREDIRVLLRPFRRGDLRKAKLVFAATDSARVNRAVCEEAQKEGAFVNVADQSAPGDFIVPAVFSGSDYHVAVASDGLSPARSVKIRDQIKVFLSNPSQLDHEKPKETSAEN
jgi:precorrin-2 dehydrogenase / sirohydrochlorin ferrochelatase